MRRRRSNPPGDTFALALLGAGLVAWWLLARGSSSSAATLDASLEVDPYATMAPGTVLPGGSVVIQ